MTEVKRNRLAGYVILRAEGMNFTKFKATVDALLTPNTLDEDEWVDFYNMYAEGRGSARYKLSVKEWALSHFQDFNLDEHEFKLKHKT